LGLTSAIGRKTYKELAKNATYIAFGRGLTFSWFAFTAFLFWGDWKQINMVVRAIGPVRWLAVWLAIWMFATAALAFWEWARAALLSFGTSEGPMLTSRYARVVYATALGLAAFVMTVLLSQSAPDVVYKTF
jgi:hypothetical protein